MINNLKKAKKHFQLCLALLEGSEIPSTPRLMYNDFDQRMKEVKAEVVSTIKLNAAFQLFHLLPLCYLGMYKYLSFYLFKFLLTFFY